MIKSILVSLILCVWSAAAAAAAHKPFLLRDPSVSRTQIAFSYAGDIWIAHRDGSHPRQLTSGGLEGKPLFSPDGSKIAFTKYTAGFTRGSVWLISAGGGLPQRLTHHPADIGAVGWTPDGKNVLFASARSSFAPSPDENMQLFTVPATGGFATALPFRRSAAGSYSPDGARIAYVPNTRWQQWDDAWKRYRGGQTQTIWIAELSSSRIEAKIPRDNSNDFDPMWVGNTVYFLSDRHGPVTLFAYEVQSHHLRQVIENHGLDLKSATASSDAIVYEQFGSLHLVDLISRKDRALDIEPAADFPEVKPRFRKIPPDSIRFADVSFAGDRAVFAVHGEILTVGGEKNAIQNLTHTPGIAERDPAWSPDGRYIAYFSDESGEYALHIRAHDGVGETRKIPLGQPPSFFYSPRWSPDAEEIAYTDKRLNYWYVNLDAGTPVRIDADLYADPVHSPQLAWSPDSHWIAYTKELRNHLHAIFLYSTIRKRSFQLTDGMSDALYIAFDKSGQYLYFTASTDVGLNASPHDMTRFEHPVTRGVYAFLLGTSVPLPLGFQSREGRMSPSQGQSGSRRSAGRATDSQFQIDLTDIRNRIVALPIPERNYYGLLAGKPGVLFLMEGPPSDPIFGPPAEAPKMLVQRFDARTGRTEQVLGDVSSFYLNNREIVPAFHLSGNAVQMLYASGNRWFIAPVDHPHFARSLPTEKMEVYVDPRAEWRHMYAQVWRDERDFFYDARLNGMNIGALEGRYAPYLENISSREDLNYLFREMLGNLSVSHMMISGGDTPESIGDHTGLLGADYTVERGRYRFARIYEQDPWSPQVRAPLTQWGATVHAGEYLMAVNGHDVRPTKDIYSFFAGTTGRQTSLTVAPNADGAESRNVTVVPIDDESKLRSYAWVEANRKKVDELTSGRVAYIYLPNTQADGYRSFNRYYFAQIGKEATIVDERYNHGGRFADYIVDYLGRPLMCYFGMRDGQDLQEPMESIVGPKVMLINEMSGSGGDLLAWMFRKATLGPLVGKRTWGGLVGIAFNPDDLLDGGYVATPSYRMFSSKGEWEVENRGVSPDIAVEDDPKAERSGHDPQLEEAVRIVLEKLKKNRRSSQSRHPS